jgi:DNA-binding transcriptional ArsR family regulator
MMPSAPAGSVPDKPRRGPVDYVALAEALDALTYPARLELLDILRTPHSLTDIKLRPHRVRPGENPDRPVALPTTLRHLQRLEDAGLVRSQRAEQDGRRVPIYFVNPSRLYELTEELRRLSVMYAGHGLPAEATGTLGGGARASAVRGPRLVLVHGVYEGKAYPLSTATAPDSRWIIGRRRGLPVALDYDPYVSLENTVLTERHREFFVTDLGSKNGTTLNWVPLAKGEAKPLMPGYVVGVGRSLLCFATD